MRRVKESESRVVVVVAAPRDGGGMVVAYGMVEWLGAVRCGAVVRRVAEDGCGAVPFEWAVDGMRRGAARAPWWRLVRVARTGCGAVRRGRRGDGGWEVARGAVRAGEDGGRQDAEVGCGRVVVQRGCGAVRRCGV